MHRQFARGEALTVLTHASAEKVIAFAETILEHIETTIGVVTVLNNRTGLVMLPYKDTAQGTLFHLGEILVAEAHVRLANGVEGYGVVVGRDLVWAVSVALIDAALAGGIMSESIQSFVAEQAGAQGASDHELLRKVEATHVEMETF